MIRLVRMPLTIITGILALSLFQTGSFAEEVTKDSTLAQREVVQSESDTLQGTFPEKRRAREPWEHIVSTPIWIATSPLWLLYKGTAAVIGFVDEHDIPEKVERVLISEDGTREIMPDYSSRTGVGVTYLKKGLISPHSELKIVGSYWLLHRHGVKLEFLNLEPAKDAFFTDISFLYEYVPDEPFFGIGPKTAESAETNYTYRGIGGGLAIGKHLFPTLSVAIEGTLGQYKISEGKDEDSPSIVPTYNSKAVLGGLQGNIDIDTRNKKGHPTTGTQFKLTGGFRDEIRRLGGHDTFRKETFGFSLFSTDLTQYIHMPWSTGRVLVLRAALETREELENKHIPFYQLSELGSDGTIRGFYRGRYRDKDAVLASVEYRYPIWADFPNSLDALLFIDAGQVSNYVFKEFMRENIRFGFGGGFRFYDDEKDDLMAKIAFGFSKREFRIQFALNE